uniref:Uncharacterized protein n=1 Tax=Arundo donax TaxID=35708 RepID=A0A0A9GLS0_ARUDO
MHTIQSTNTEYKLLHLLNSPNLYKSLYLMCNHHSLDPTHSLRINITGNKHRQ